MPIASQLDAGCKSIYSPTFEMIGPATIASGVVTLHGVDPFELRGSAQLIAKEGKFATLRLPSGEKRAP